MAAKSENRNQGPHCSMPPLATFAACRRSLGAAAAPAPRTALTDRLHRGMECTLLGALFACDRVHRRRCPAGGSVYTKSCCALVECAPMADACPAQSPAPSGHAAEHKPPPATTLCAPPKEWMQASPACNKLSPGHTGTSMPWPT
jgi:hypothetical protein